jgi:fibronectin-binding autotransporter adhesin
MRNGITSRLTSRRSSAQRFMVRVFTLLTLMVSLIPRSSQATVIDWSSTASTTAWATGSNWVGNTAPANSLVTDIARFDKTSYLNQPNSGTTSINGIQIGDGTTAAAVLTLTNTALSIGGSGITMFANAGAATLTGGLVKIGANQSWSNDSSSLLTISSSITNIANTTPFTLTLNGSGTGGTTIGGIISDGGTTGTTAVTVNRTGGGTVTLSGVNTYTGVTTLTLGTLKLSGSGTLGSTSGALTVNGGTLDLNGTSQGVGNFTGSGGTILNNSTGTNVTLTIGNNNGTGGNYSGVIADHTSGTGTVALTKTGTGTLTLSGTNTFTGGVTLNAGTLSISSDANLGASSGSITFGGGTLAATNNVVSSRAINMSGAGTFSPSFGKTLEESGAVSGNGNLTVAGNGTLILSGSGSNGTGTTTLSGGVLSLRGTVSLGSGNLAFGTGVLELGNGNFTRALGTLANQINMSSATGGAGFSAYGADRVVNLGGSGATVTWNAGNFVANGQPFYLGTPTADHMVDFQNSIDLNAGTRTITVTDGVGTGADAKISGVISGTGASNLVISTVGVAPWNPGTLILSGTNTYVGTTTVSAGTLNIQNGSALGTTAGSTTVSSGATLQLQNNITVGAEALTISGTGASGQNGALVNVSGTNNYGGLLTLGAASTISSDSGTLNLTNIGTITGATFGLTLTGSGNGSISSIIGTTSGALTKSGTGSWTLSGANTYTGGTTINGGTLVVNSASSLGATSGGATINAGTLEVATGYSASRTFTLGDAASTFQIDPSQTFTVTSAIGGSGVLNKTGSGTMVLSGANTYSGGTNVNVGTLQISASERLANAGALTISGGTFDLQTFNETVAGVTLTSGSITGSGSATLTGSSYAMQSGTVSAILAGAAVALTKTTSGTVTLSGANTFTGATTISGGTLNAGGTGALAGTSSVTVNASGTLLLSNTGLTNRVSDTAPVALSAGTGAPSSGGRINAGQTADTVSTSETIGALTLNNNSTIDLASTMGSHFALTAAGTSTLSATAANYALVLNWDGTPGQLGTGSTDRLLFANGVTGFSGGSTTDQMLFNIGGTLYYSEFLSTGGSGLEAVAFTPVPEPSTWIAGGLAFATFAFSQRRKVAKWLRIKLVKRQQLALDV